MGFVAVETTSSSSSLTSCLRISRIHYDSHNNNDDEETIPTTPRKVPPPRRRLPLAELNTTSFSLDLSLETKKNRFHHRHPPKMVRFVKSTRNIIVPSSMELTQEDIGNGWWSMKELTTMLDDFQNHAQTVVAGLVDEPSSSVPSTTKQLLLDIFKLCERTATTSDGHVDDMVSAQSILDQLDTDALERWSSFRCMETAIVQQIPSIRKLHQQSIVACKLPSNLNPQLKCNMLAKRSKRTSTSCTLFAQVIGHVDEYILTTIQD